MSGARKQAKGSMDQIKKFKPLGMLRVNSEQVIRSKFFSSEGTPVRPMRTTLKLDRYNESVFAQ